MELSPNFAFRPLPPIELPIHFPFPTIANPLGPLQDLAGSWSGTGFNTIWRPFFGPGSDHFLELNVTAENLEFTGIGGPIPNRGLLQKDINMFGMTYLQQISDSNLKAGQHIEPGIWATAPSTANPNEPPTVIRMASIPHGTTILAQGQSTTIAGPPTFPHADITPFFIGNPAHKQPFPQESILTNASNFRSPANQLVGVTQAMVDNPNSLLQAAIAGQTIKKTTVLNVSTAATSPLTGGGASNSSFLQGGAGGPNAKVSSVTATFWIETVQGAPGHPDFKQLQYTQTVMLDFAPLTWPHVTVGTLVQKKSVFIPWHITDPRISEVLNPATLLDRGVLPIERSGGPLVEPKG